MPSRHHLAALAAVLALPVAAAQAAPTSLPVVKRSVKHHARHMLPAGLPRAHYSYRTTIISGPPVPYDARPFAYGRWDAVTQAHAAYWEGVLRKATQAPEWRADLERNFWSDDFVTGHQRKLRIREVAIHHMQVGPANGTR